MYKWGWAASLLVVVLFVTVSGCTLTGGGNSSAGNGTQTAAIETPTLPDQYIAQPVSTINPGTVPVVPSPSPGNLPVINAAAQTTINATSLTGTAYVCPSYYECTNVSVIGNSSSPSGNDMTPPTAQFTANISMGMTVPLAAEFTSEPNTPPYASRWGWNGGNAVSLISESDQTLDLLFNQYGYYQVNRFVTNSNGTAVNSSTISVCPLVASFTTSQTTGLVPLSVQFTDTSTNQPTGWLWNFGDGTQNSTLQNPKHLYATSGVYTARLDATNNQGSCWNTTSITVSPLTASFNANQTTGLEPLAVQFTDTSTDLPIKWSWNFGDSGTSGIQNPVHTYTAPGIYTMNLSATNGFDGWMSSPSILITVFSLPQVSFTASPRSGTPGTSVIFADGSTSFPNPVSWYWDFGDGYSSTQQNPSHQYTSPGSYDVNHSATNPQGTVWLNETGYITIS
jgi:PKD repeat protein